MELESLNNKILEKYRNLTNPNYSFVGEALRLRPYQTVFDELSRVFTIEDITDSNDDVCFRSQLLINDKLWVLELSMVARYAVLLRISGEKIIELVEVPIFSPEEEVFKILLKYNIEILSKKILEIPFQITLLNTDALNTRYYQALFSDTDILPWDESFLIK